MLTQQVKDYLNSYYKAMDEYAARLVTNGPRDEHVLYYTTVDGARRVAFPDQTRFASARAAIRHAYGTHTVHWWDTTTRDGAEVRIVQVRYNPGTWSNVTEVIDVYEIPTEYISELDRALRAEDKRHATSSAA